MDIYFCDLCGVRVTEVDLRAGHGIRKRRDVICSNCLEVGHGSDWLNQHADDAKEPAVAAASGPAPGANADYIKKARDRARTRARTDTDTDDGLGESFIPADHADAIPEFEDIPEVDHVVTAKMPGKSGEEANRNLASAAGAFSALSSRPTGQQVEMDIDEDDIADQRPESRQGSRTDFTPAAPESPFSSGARKEAKAEITAKPTPRSGAKPEKSEKPEQPPGSAKNKPSTRRNSTTQGKSSSALRAPVSGKPRTGRRGPSNSNVLVFSLISLTLLTASFLILFKDRIFHKAPAQKTEQINLSEETKKKVTAARNLATSALRNKDPEQLQAAKEAILSARNDIDAFDVEARKQKFTDEQIEIMIEKQLKWQETNMLMRSINDELQRQKE